MATTTNATQSGQFTVSSNAQMVNPLTVTKISQISEWNAPFYSKSSIVGPWSVYFQPQDNNSIGIVGVVTSITDTIVLSAVEYGIYFSGGYAQVYESGVPVYSIGSYKSGDTFMIHFDGINVSYMQNDVSEYVSMGTDSPSQNFYMAGILYTPGLTLGQLIFQKSPYVSLLTTSAITPPLTLSAATYNTMIQSIVSYPPGIYCYGIPMKTSASAAVAFGLNKTAYNPAAPPPFNISNIDYGFIITNTISIIIYGTTVQLVNTPIINAKFQIVYDGREVKWYQNSALLYIKRDPTTYSTTPYGLLVGFTAGCSLASATIGSFQASTNISGPPAQTYYQVVQQPATTTGRSYVENIMTPGGGTVLFNTIAALPPLNTPAPFTLASLGTPYTLPDTLSTLSSYRPF